MYYATNQSRPNGPVELHVFQSKRERDCYTLEPLFRTGECDGRRDATTADAKSCDPWSIVVHDTSLIDLYKLPVWAYRMAANATTWYAQAGDLHFCLV